MRVPWAALIDLACVAAFVAIGRANHDEQGAVLGFLSTAWPFAVALAAGWLGVRAWRAPAALLPTGLVVWAATVVVGLFLRVVSDTGGAPWSFAVVTTVFLAVTLLGWRAVALLVAARAGRRATASDTGRQAAFRPPFR